MFFNIQSIKILFKGGGILALDVIRQIREAEEAAEQIKQKSLSEKNEIILQAQKEAEAIIKEAEAKAKEQEEIIINVHEEEGLREAEELIEAVKAECQSAMQVVDSNADKAASFIIERIVNFYGNS